MTQESTVFNTEETYISGLEKTVFGTEEDMLISKTNKNKNFFQTITDIAKSGIEFYFSPKSFERWKNGRIYEIVGVGEYKKFLPTGGDYVARWIGFKPISDASSTENGLRFYERFTRICESIHTIALPIYTIPIILSFYCGDLKSATGILLLNLAINGYPIMVQRYNRTRIYNALDKIESRRASQKQ